MQEFLRGDTAVPIIPMTQNLSRGRGNRKVRLHGHTSVIHACRNFSTGSCTIQDPEQGKTHGEHAKCFGARHNQMANSAGENCPAPGLEWNVQESLKGLCSPPLVLPPFRGSAVEGQD